MQVALKALIRVRDVRFIELNPTAISFKHSLPLGIGADPSKIRPMASTPYIILKENGSNLLYHV